MTNASGQKTVTTAGTAVTLGNGRIDGALLIKALDTNTGVVALGNDYGGGPGSFELGIPMYEIEMMAQAGMTAEEIVRAGTRDAARVLGLGEMLGTLELGKLADVLVVDGDPLEDLQALGRIRLVIHSGAIIRSQGAAPVAAGTPAAR